MLGKKQMCLIVQTKLILDIWCTFSKNKSHRASHIHLKFFSVWNNPSLSLSDHTLLSSSGFISFRVWVVSYTFQGFLVLHVPFLWLCISSNSQSGTAEFLMSTRLGMKHILTLVVTNVTTKISSLIVLRISRPCS